MEKNLLKVVSLTLSGSVEEAIYKSAYSHISRIQRSLSQQQLPPAQTERNRFWSAISWGTKVMDSVTDFNADSISITTPNGEIKILFDDIQYIHSMNALSEGIAEVLISKCAYPKSITCLGDLTAVDYRVSNKGITLLCDVPPQDDPSRSVSDETGNIEIAWGIQQRDFFRWVEAYNLPGKTIYDFRLWERRFCV